MPLSQSAIDAQAARGAKAKTILDAQKATVPQTPVIPAALPVPTPDDGKWITGGTPNPNTTAGQAMIAKQNGMRNPPVYPTPEDPIRSIGTKMETTTPTTGTQKSTAFSGMAEKDKFTTIATKKASGQALSDEEKQYLASLAYDASAPIDPDEYKKPITDAYNEAITGAETEFTTTEEKLRTQREKRIADQNRLYDEQYARDAADIQNQGTEQKKTVQGALSFSGFGRSTYNADKQLQIQQDVTRRQDLMARARDQEKAAFKAQLEGADDETLSGLRKNISDLKIKAAEADMSAVQEVAKMNQANKVKGVEAIDNMAKILQGGSSAFDIPISKEINDGFLYKIGANGLPERVQDANGQDIRTGVNDSENSDIQFSPPKQDAFGNLVSPGYIFNKKTQQLISIDPNGNQSTINVNNPQNAIAVYKNFDDYLTHVGNGTIVKGSPYHTGDGSGGTFELDIDGKIGDPIQSFTGGKVVSVKDERKSGLGKSITIEDGYGNLITYGHLSGTNVANGQILSPGQMIGAMGNSGAVIAEGKGDGSHLHIQGRDKSGKLVNLSDITAGNTVNYNTFGSNAGGNLPQGWLSDAIRKGYDDTQKQSQYKALIQSGSLPPDLNQLKAQNAPQTADQKKAEGFANRVQDSIKIFNNIEKDITAISPAEFIVYRNTPSSLNAFTPPKVQQQFQAERNFVNAVLRRESGAAISPTEFESATLQYFPTAGDSKEVLAQKKRNRDQVLQSLLIESSNNYSASGTRPSLDSFTNQ